MKKKEKSTGEKFENFIELAMNQYIKNGNLEMKYYSEEKFLTELENIANELNCDVKHGKVFREWLIRNRSEYYAGKIKIAPEAHDFIRLTYFSPEQCVYAIERDKDTGKTIRIRRTKESYWEDFADE